MKIDRCIHCVKKDWEQKMSKSAAKDLGRDRHGGARMFITTGKAIKRQ